MSSKNKEIETKGIQVMLILEMIGRPAEHIIASMNEVINEMGKEKGIKILSKDVHEPLELKENKEFFSTFAEVEIEAEEIANLAILMFKYMPAHIEIIQPELIALTNTGWSDILSELTRRLHGYDEVARVLQYQNAELQDKINKLNSPKIYPVNEESKSTEKKTSEKKQTKNKIKKKD